MIDILRFANLLQNMFPQSGSQEQQDPFKQEQVNPLEQMFPIKNDAENMLKSQLQGMPSRENFKPGKMRQIGGILASLGTGRPAGIAGGQPIGFIGNPEGGLKAQQAILNEPYDQAIKDWALKLKPIGEMADLERASNSNARMLRAQQITDQNKDAALKAKIDSDEAKAQIERDKLTEKYAYLDFLKEKQANPNNIYKADSEGFVYSIDPHTDEVKYLTDRDGNQIKADKLPEQERARIQHQNKLSEIKATGDQRNRNILTQGAQQRETNKEKVTGTAAKPLSPSQDKVRQIRTAKELLERNPEFKGYITPIDDWKDFRVKIVPGDPISERILNEVYGDKRKDTPVAPDVVAKPPATDDKRNKAIELLKKNNKVVNEQTIKTVMDRMK